MGLELPTPTNPSKLSKIWFRAFGPLFADGGLSEKHNMTKMLKRANNGGGKEALACHHVSRHRFLIICSADWLEPY